MIIKAVVAAILLLPVILGGCGSSSSDATGETSTSTTSEVPVDTTREVPARVILKTTDIDKATYIARANLRCDGVWHHMLRSYTEIYPSVAHAFRTEPNPSPKAEKGFETAAQETLLPYLQEEFDNVQYLGAPEGEDEPVTTVLRALQDAVYDGQEQTVSTPQQLAAFFIDFNQLARQYGIDHCLTQATRFDPTGKPREPTQTSAPLRPSSVSVGASN